MPRGQINIIRLYCDQTTGFVGRIASVGGTVFVVFRGRHDRNVGGIDGDVRSRAARATMMNTAPPPLILAK